MKDHFISNVPYTYLRQLEAKLFELKIFIQTDKAATITFPTEYRKEGLITIIECRIKKSRKKITSASGHASYLIERKYLNNDSETIEVRVLDEYTNDLRSSTMVFKDANEGTLIEEQSTFGLNVPYSYVNYSDAFYEKSTALNKEIQVGFVIFKDNSGKPSLQKVFKVKAEKGGHLVIDNSSVIPFKEEDKHKTSDGTILINIGSNAEQIIKKNGSIGGRDPGRSRFINYV